MTPDRLNAEYARQLRLMAKLRIEHEKPRHLRLLAREAEQRPGARLPGPDEGYEIAVWADLHLSEETIR